MNKTTDVPEHNATNVVSFFRSRHILPCSEVNHVFWRMTNRRIELDFIVSDEKVPASQGVLMTFISRAARYVLRKRVRTAVLFIVLTIITASMLSATAVSRAAQHEAGQIEKQAVGGFVLASNLQGSMLTPRGGGMVRPADVQRISKLSGVGSCMVRQNATADLVGASVVKVPGGDDYDAEKEQQFGNTANVIGTNDSSKLNVFTSHTLGMVEGRHLKASDKHMSMVHEDLAKTNGLKVGDTLTLKANPYDADNESHSTATVKTTIVGIFKGDSDRKVSSRAELTSNTVYTDLDTTSTLYQYKAGKEIYQDATFVLDRGVDVEKPWKRRRSFRWIGTTTRSRAMTNIRRAC